MRIVETPSSRTVTIMHIQRAAYAVRYVLVLLGKPRFDLDLVVIALFINLTVKQQQRFDSHAFG